MVIALGTGSYAGLSSVTRWRRASTDEGYRTLAMYDLRLRLPEGADVPEGTLAELIRGDTALPLAAAQERLIVEVQVDASTAGSVILVPGVLYGAPVGSAAEVNTLHVAQGRGLTEGDSGQPVALLERNFAHHYDLPPAGDIRLSGGGALAYVGHAIAPEYFIVTTDRGGLLAEANFAAVFTSLATAQQVSGKSGRVNDLVLTLREPRDRAAAAAALSQYLTAAAPELGARVTTREEDPSFRINDADIDGDQQVYDIFAFLMFAGAVVAAFNLIARVVESQRREIGLAMVLGLQPARIAIRPALLAAEIAFLGVVFGIGVGIVIGQAMATVLRDLMPLPHWDTAFRFDVFLAVGVAGFLLPFVATIWPVWRAVRVPPVSAIQAGYRMVRGGGLAPLFARVRLPGGTFIRMPFRNVVRSPRRTALTVVGIAAALAALVAFVGLIDSFLSTIDRGSNEVLRTNPGRVEVALDQPYPAGGPQTQAIASAASVAGTEEQLRLSGRASRGDTTVELQIDLFPLDSAVWRPSISEGALQPGRSGIYLSELAARQLDAGPGDRVALQHPRLQADGTVTLVTDEVEVLGLHPHPFRFVAYMDLQDAALFNMAGRTNLVVALPAGNASREDLKQDLFALQGVTSVQGVAEVAEVLDDLLGEFVIVLRVVEGAMLLLAVLIAFNSASINMDERSREHATMFAFGVPVRQVLGMAVLENLVIGVASTVAGLLGGWALLRLIIAIRIPETLPDIDVPATISGGTYMTTIVLGIVAVAAAPLFTWRRLHRMNVPVTLKVFD